jgi:drug/metabolite transporter (DMT)-like permease
MSDDQFWFCWAASAVVVKRFQAAHPGVDILSLTTWQMLFSSLPLVLVAALTWQGSPDWTLQFDLALAYNVLLGNALAWLLWLFGLRRLPAGAAGIATLAAPVIGVTAAWVQLGERPSAGEAAGMALIIAALAMVTVRGVVTSRGAGDTRERRGAAAGD